MAKAHSRIWGHCRREAAAQCRGLEIRRSHRRCRTQCGRNLGPTKNTRGRTAERVKCQFGGGINECTHFDTVKLLVLLVLCLVSERHAPETEDEALGKKQSRTDSGRFLIVSRSTEKRSLRRSTWRRVRRCGWRL